MGEDFSLNIEENDKLAELIGIILGDGHLHKKGEKNYLDSILSISINRVEEAEYVEYIKNLLIQMFKLKPKLFPRKDSKSIDLKISNGKIIDFLISKGLKTGDKAKNQIFVPDWIKKDIKWIEKNREVWYSRFRPLVIACLRGLVDTDGSIYVDHFNKIIGIGFKGASLPLVIDFKEMCKSLNIRSGKITESPYHSIISDKIYIAYQVLIRAKNHVKRFLDVIKPMKWEFRKDIIQATLKDLGTNIEEALKSKYKRKDSNSV